MSNKAGEERGLYWWVRYVVVPIIGGGGVIAIIVAFIARQSSLPSGATPTFVSSPIVPAMTQLPESTTPPNMQWTIIEGHIVLDPNGKYWEKYQDDSNLAGLYLRLKDLTSISESPGDYLELRADETFELEEGGIHISGTWQSVSANEIVLNFP